MQVLDGLENLEGSLQPDASRLRACAHLEAAAQSHDVGHVADAQAHLDAAGKLLGIDVEVTGGRLPLHPFSVLDQWTTLAAGPCSAML